MATSSTPDMGNQIGYSVTDGNDIGGAATVKLGVWGATPIARSALSTVPVASIPVNTTLSTGSIAATSTDFWGFAGSAQLNNLITTVRALAYNALQQGWSASA